MQYIYYNIGNSQIECEAKQGYNEVLYELCAMISMRAESPNPVQSVGDKRGQDEGRRGCNYRRNIERLCQYTEHNDMDQGCDNTDGAKPYETLHSGSLTTGDCEERHTERQSDSIDHIAFAAKDPRK